MAVPTRYILAALAFGVAALGFMMLPSEASADCGNSPCRRPPPRCSQHCNPPAPPPPINCCQPPVVVAPPPHVPPPNIVVVNAGARAQAQASAVAIAIAEAGAQGDTIIRQNMIMEGNVSAQAHSMAMSVVEASVEMESRSVEREFLIQAICVDERGNPHPASQTFGSRDVATSYRGEIYRCMSGTRMRYTINGRSVECAAGEALWYENGQVSCRPQIARRPCNERSLLRRFGAGDKMVRVRETEQREARRETSYTGAMSMDGGVGGAVY